jgi:hypothetical protein
VQAADTLGIGARHMRRLRRKVEVWGMSAVMDQRGAGPGASASRPAPSRGSVPFLRGGVFLGFLQHGLAAAEQLEAHGHKAGI